MPTKPEQISKIDVIEQIEEKIYVIRGQRGMLDSDLAEVYQVETRVLNQALKRNLKRFPPDFMFQLNDVEVESLRNSSQFVMSSKKHRGATYKPYVFTEHGAVMLASILNSPTAVEASIVVVRAFVKMRAMLALHQDLPTALKSLRRLPITTDRNSEPFLRCSAK